MPVTTPRAKLMPKILAQKRAAREKCSSLVRSAMDFRNDDEQGEAHRQLGEEIMESDRKSEVKSVDVQRGTHRTPLKRKSQGANDTNTWMSAEERTAGDSFADFRRLGNEKPALRKLD